MNSNGQKPNSHDGHVGSPEQPLHPLENVFSPAPHTDALLQMQTGLFELGRNRSKLSGTAKPIPADICSLEEHARSIARDTYRDQFDPEKNAHDRMHHAEYERLLELRDEVARGVAHATANVHESEMAFATTPKAGAKPEANGWLTAAFIVA